MNFIGTSTGNVGTANSDAKLSVNGNLVVKTVAFTNGAAGIYLLFGFKDI